MWGSCAFTRQLSLLSLITARQGAEAHVHVSFAARRSISSTSRLSATKYLLQYSYIPEVLEKRGPYREKHLNLAKGLIAEGKCLSGGPTGTPGVEVPTGAMFIFTEEAAAKAFVEQDPYVANGIVTSHTIEEWNVVVGE